MRRPDFTEMYRERNAVEHLLQLGTPVYIPPAIVPLPQALISSELSQGAVDPDVEAAVHGLVVDVRTEGLCPYYMIMRTTEACKEVVEHRIGKDHAVTENIPGKLRTEIHAVTHRDLVGQQKYLTCHRTASEHDRLDLCPYCTGKVVHPVVSFDLKPTARESALLYDLPPFNCFCGKSVLQSSSHISKSSNGDSRLASSRDLEMSAEKVHMTTLLLGAPRRQPCCSIECALRYSKNFPE